MLFIKNYLTKIKLFCFVVLALQACEQPIDLPVQNYDGSIVIYSVLESDSFPKVIVTESEPYYTYINNTEIDYEPIQNASVKITDGEQTWDLIKDSIVFLTIEDDNFQWIKNGPSENEKIVAFTNKEVVLQPSTSYKVIVEKANKKATAETYILNRPVDFTIEYYNDGYNSSNSIIEYNYENSTKNIWYRIMLKSTRKFYDCDWNQNPPVSVDSVFVYQYKFSNREKSDLQNGLVNDAINFFSIAGCNTINYDCNNFVNPDSAEIQIALQAIDSNLINYITQLEFQEEISDNPFIEPAPVDNNVEGGIGIVSSISNSYWKTIKVPCN